MVSARPACALAASAAVEQGHEQRGAASRDRTNSPGWMGASRRRWQAAARANSRYDGVMRRAVSANPFPDESGVGCGLRSGDCKVALCFSAPELSCIKQLRFEWRAVSRKGYNLIFMYLFF